ncbi:uncharacterized protein PV07_12760, partial [Cladophialophora immunda]
VLGLKRITTFSNRVVLRDWGRMLVATSRGMDYVSWVYLSTEDQGRISLLAPDSLNPKPGHMSHKDIDMEKCRHFIEYLQPDGS